MGSVFSKVKKFINAESEKEIIFTGGTTAAINLVAQTFGRKALKAGESTVILRLTGEEAPPPKVVCLLITLF
jgi:selenocysteine lyase/cysteine desulfurase